MAVWAKNLHRVVHGLAEDEPHGPTHAIDQAELALQLLDECGELRQLGLRVGDALGPVALGVGRGDDLGARGQVEIRLLRVDQCRLQLRRGHAGEDAAIRVVGHGEAGAEMKKPAWSGFKGSTEEETCDHWTDRFGTA